MAWSRLRKGGGDGTPPGDNGAVATRPRVEPAAPQPAPRAAEPTPPKVDFPAPPPPPRNDWAKLPPLHTLPGPSPIIDRRFEARLGTWQNPMFALEPLGHVRSPEAPAGTVLAKATPITTVIDPVPAAPAKPEAVELPRPLELARVLQPAAQPGSRVPARAPERLFPQTEPAAPKAPDPNFVRALVEDEPRFPDSHPRYLPDGGTATQRPANEGTLRTLGDRDTEKLDSYAVRLQANVVSAPPAPSRVDPELALATPQAAAPVVEPPAPAPGRIRIGEPILPGEAVAPSPSLPVAQRPTPPAKADAPRVEERAPLVSEGKPPAVIQESQRPTPPAPPLVERPLDLADTRSQARPAPLERASTPPPAPNESPTSPVQATPPQPQDSPVAAPPVAETHAAPREVEAAAPPRSAVVEQAAPPREAEAPAPRPSQTNDVAPVLSAAPSPPVAPSTPPPPATRAQPAPPAPPLPLVAPAPRSQRADAPTGARPPLPAPPPAAPSVTAPPPPAPPAAVTPPAPAASPVAPPRAESVPPTVAPLVSAPRSDSPLPVVERSTEPSQVGRREQAASDLPLATPRGEATPSARTDPAAPAPGADPPAQPVTPPSTSVEPPAPQVIVESTQVIVPLVSASPVQRPTVAAPLAPPVAVPEAPSGRVPSPRDGELPLATPKTAGQVDAPRQEQTAAPRAFRESAPPPAPDSAASRPDAPPAPESAPPEQPTVHAFETAPLLGERVLGDLVATLPERVEAIVVRPRKEPSQLPLAEQHRAPQPGALPGSAATPPAPLPLAASQASAPAAVVAPMPVAPLMGERALVTQVRVVEPPSVVAPDLEPAPPQLPARVNIDPNVTVRVGRSTDAAARTLGARAFTMRGEIHVPSTSLARGGPEVRALVAHELTHVTQQRILGGQLPGEHSPDGRALEAEARAAEVSVRQGLGLRIPQTSAVASQMVGKAPVLPLAQRPLPQPQPEPEPVAAAVSFASASDSPASWVNPFHSGAIQRAEDEDASADTGAGGGAGGGSAGAGEDDIGALVMKMYPLIEARMRTELWRHRDRTGRTTDMDL